MWVYVFMDAPNIFPQNNFFFVIFFHKKTFMSCINALNM